MSREEIINLFTIEWCPFCDEEVAIYSYGITACPSCGKPLVPCSVCDGCSEEPCPYGCEGDDSDEYLDVTNPPITKERSDYLKIHLAVV